MRVTSINTVFPIPLAESCTWDPPLLERAARVAAEEASAAGVDWTFAPMVDIARDPRWGRIAEGAGEDVFLGCQMVAARVAASSRMGWPAAGGWAARGERYAKSESIIAVAHRKASAAMARQAIAAMTRE